MSQLFAETLKKLRLEKGLNQRQLAERLYVARSSVNRWENGSRLPDAAMLFRLSEVLGVDINLLFTVAAESDSSPNVIMLDDNKIVLNGGLAILEDVIPTASVTRFTSMSEHSKRTKPARSSWKTTGSTISRATTTSRISPSPISVSACKSCARAN